jgi:formylglycine-generating enzyme required for sulfatase activity
LQDIAVVLAADVPPILFKPVQAGSFMMGARGESAREEPIHCVEISQPFYLAQTQVTQAQFACYTVANAIEHKNHFAGNPDNPAENMDWHEATGFCRWLNSEFQHQLADGHAADLPSEAQWEFACRGDSGRFAQMDYHTGSGAGALHRAGWFRENAASTTQIVGPRHPDPRQPNDYGLYDMHGNVDEWCRDVFDTAAYSRREHGVVDPEVLADEATESPRRVFRGGSWFNAARLCRAAFRVGGHPGDRLGNQGFRVGLFPVQSCQTGK